MKYLYAIPFIAAGALMLGYVVYSLKRGEFYIGKGRGTIYWRATNPWSFWFSLSTFALAGIGALVAGGVLLFVKLPPL